MNAYAVPNLDAHLAADPFPAPRYRDRDEHVDAVTAEIRADRDRMLVLIEEADTERDESELLDELRQLRWLLAAAPDKDLRAASELMLYRRDFRKQMDELAKSEAQFVVDGER